jgi:hypothetical protein
MGMSQLPLPWLQVTYLLGGGSDFSSGGPGKGMHSRLYQNVLTKRTWVTSCSAYSNVFENTGLLGIMMSTPDPTRADELVGIICSCVLLSATSASQVLVSLLMPQHFVEVTPCPPCVGEVAPLPSEMIFTNSTAESMLCCNQSYTKARRPTQRWLHRPCTQFPVNTP